MDRHFCRLFRFFFTGNRWFAFLRLASAGEAPALLSRSPLSRLASWTLAVKLSPDPRRCRLLRSAARAAPPDCAPLHRSAQTSDPRVRPLPSPMLFCAAPANFFVSLLIVRLATRDGRARIHLQMRPSVVPFDFQAFHLEPLEDDHWRANFEGSSERKISPEAFVKSEIASATWLLLAACCLPRWRCFAESQKHCSRLQSRQRSSGLFTTFVRSETVFAAGLHWKPAREIVLRPALPYRSFSLNWQLAALPVSERRSVSRPFQLVPVEARSSASLPIGSQVILGLQTVRTWL